MKKKSLFQEPNREDTFFQYYDETVDNINRAMPKNLVEDKVYNFSMMGMDADNWAQIILEEEFIPRNLEEYVAINSEKEKEKEKETLLAFAGNANGNKNTTYIYFLPKETAFEYRYYETEDTLVDPTDFANYKRQNLIDTPQFGGKFRRFSNASLDAVWCLVSYIADGKLHISPPMKTKNETRTTVWSTNIEPTYPEVLKPVFTWSDTRFEERVSYLQVFTKDDDVFLSGTFAAENTFQYYNEATIISKIHTETPPRLVIDDRYKFYVYGLTADNWVNFILQKSFIAE